MESKGEKKIIKYYKKLFLNKCFGEINLTSSREEKKCVTSLNTKMTLINHSFT